MPYGVPVWRATTRCTRVAHTRCTHAVHTRCTRAVHTCGAHMRCTHAVHMCGTHVRYPRALLSGARACFLTQVGAACATELQSRCAATLHRDASRTAPPALGGAQAPTETETSAACLDRHSRAQGAQQLGKLCREVRPPSPARPPAPSPSPQPSLSAALSSSRFTLVVHPPPSPPPFSPRPSILPPSTPAPPPPFARCCWRTNCVPRSRSTCSTRCASRARQTTPTCVRPPRRRACRARPCSASRTTATCCRCVQTDPRVRLLEQHE